MFLGAHILGVLKYKLSDTLPYYCLSSSCLSTCDLYLPVHALADPTRRIVPLLFKFLEVPLNGRCADADLFHHDRGMDINWLSAICSRIFFSVSPSPRPPGPANKSITGTGIYLKAPLLNEVQNGLAKIRNHSLSH